MSEKGLLTENSYNRLKKLHRVGFPSVGVILFILWKIFDLVDADWIAGGLFLTMLTSGLTLQISSKKYEGNGVRHFGQIVVTTREDGKKLFSLELEGDPREISNEDEVSFKVVDQPSEGYEK